VAIALVASSMPIIWIRRAPKSENPMPSIRCFSLFVSRTESSVTVA
jgi:hypothetical protein